MPKGVYEIDEETQDLKMAEEQPDLGVEPLKSLEAWCHLPKHILKAGRCSHLVPANIADDDKEGYLEKLNETDKAAEPLFAINEDAPMAGREGAPWVSKVCGDTTQYKAGEGTVSYAVNVLESLRWPGSVTVSKGGDYCSIYIGDGIKQGDNLFDPIEPPEVNADPVEPDSQPEPQGKERKLLTEENAAAIRAAIEANEEQKEAGAGTAEEVTALLKGLGEDFTDEVVGTIMIIAKPDGEGKIVFEDFIEAAMHE